MSSTFRETYQQATLRPSYRYSLRGRVAPPSEVETMKRRRFLVGFAIGSLLSAGLAFGVTQASAASGNPTYYACLKGGKLSQVGAIPPHCKAPATPISWVPTEPMLSSARLRLTVPAIAVTQTSHSALTRCGAVWPVTGLIQAADIKGATGAQGPSGLEGPQGAQGTTGSTGPAGTAGPPGQTYQWVGSSTYEGNVDSVEIVTDISGTMTFPAGTTLQVDSASISGDFSACQADDFFFGTQPGFPNLASWLVNPVDGSVSGLAPYYVACAVYVPRDRFAEFL